MGILEGFFRALSFLTILPCPKRESTVEEYGRASGWFPVAGAVLGAILYAAALLFHRSFSPLPASALVVALWAFLTRGFHLDGLADTFDGIGGGFDRESRLAVMKDSRLGTFGGTALAAALLLKTVILAEFGGRLEVLVIAPALGRWGILIAMRFFPSAR
ncbi:MAG TPA: adenosylcobinamide-GDP ribazoletransferase, partial [Aminobacteriaceae bacterium]|nr:adenosylcobinamide-GDP ribazoletransferase [Aminobacteriaceae bacterium]